MGQDLLLGNGKRCGHGASSVICTAGLLPCFGCSVQFLLAFAAYRVLYLKDMFKGARPKAVDWLAAAVTVLSSLLLFVMGFLQPGLMGVGVIQIAGHAVSIVSIAFGIIGMRMGLGSIHGFIKPSKEKMFWWFSHMQGMMGSYIAAMTAFSAVNLTRWLGGYGCGRRL
jgi:hypothetical protein